MFLPLRFAQSVSAGWPHEAFHYRRVSNAGHIPARVSGRLRRRRQPSQTLLDHCRQHLEWVTCRRRGRFPEATIPAFLPRRFSQSGLKSVVPSRGARALLQTELTAVMFRRIGNSGAVFATAELAWDWAAICCGMSSSGKLRAGEGGGGLR
jgi:hypothetical protein